MLTIGSAPPHPAVLVESLVTLGYSLEASVAEMIHDCLDAGSSFVDFSDRLNVSEPCETIFDLVRKTTRGNLMEELRREFAEALGGEGGPQ